MVAAGLVAVGAMGTVQQCVARMPAILLHDYFEA